MAQREQRKSILLENDHPGTGMERREESAFQVGDGRRTVGYDFLLHSSNADTVVAECAFFLSLTRCRVIEVPYNEFLSMFRFSLFPVWNLWRCLWA